MKAMRLGEAALLPATIESNIPQPAPSRGEVLVRVHAAGVTPSEVIWYPTTHDKAGGVRQRAIPGHEFSGVVAAVGGEVKDVAVGQAVYGMNDWFGDGATVEYCMTQPQWIAEKPSRLTHAEAATVPIGALTAWQGLLDRAKLQRGERVLIHGGSGAVGVFAVQLARRAGAQIITTASARNVDFLTELGAAQVIDYHNQQFDKIVRDFDVIFDTVGGETFNRSWDLLKPAGRMITVAADNEGASDERRTKAFFIVEANRNQLTEIAALLDRGELRAFVDAEVPLDQASQAYENKINNRRGRGKTVVVIAK